MEHIKTCLGQQNGHMIAKSITDQNDEDIVASTASQGHFVQNRVLVRGSGKIKPKAASASFKVEIL